MDYSATLSAIQSMSLEDRVRLVQAIWDSVATEAEPALTDSQRQELDRRLAASEAAPEKLIPWNEVKAKTLAKLRK
jgi:putative addiction module component (TIGR02574 family)